MVIILCHSCGVGKGLVVQWKIYRAESTAANSVGGRRDGGPVGICVAYQVTNKPHVRNNLTQNLTNDAAQAFVTSADRSRPVGYVGSGRVGALLLLLDRNVIVIESRASPTRRVPSRLFLFVRPAHDGRVGRDSLKLNHLREFLRTGERDGWGVAGRCAVRRDGVEERGAAEWRIFTSSAIHASQGRAVVEINKQTRCDVAREPSQGRRAFRVRVGQGRLRRPETRDIFPNVKNDLAHTVVPGIRFRRPGRFRTF